MIFDDIADLPWLRARLAGRQEAVERARNALSGALTDQDNLRCLDDRWAEDRRGHAQQMVEAAKTALAVAEDDVRSMRHHIELLEAVEAGTELAAREADLAGAVAALNDALDEFHSPGKCALPTCRRDLEKVTKMPLFCPIHYKEGTAKRAELASRRDAALADLHACQASFTQYVSRSHGLDVLVEAVKNNLVPVTKEDDALVAYLDAYQSERRRQQIAPAELAELEALRSANSTKDARIAELERMVQSLSQPEPEPV